MCKSAILFTLSFLFAVSLQSAHSQNARKTNRKPTKRSAKKVPSAKSGEQTSGLPLPGYKPAAPDYAETYGWNFDFTHMMYNKNTLWIVDTKVEGDITHIDETPVYEYKFEGQEAQPARDLAAPITFRSGYTMVFTGSSEVFKEDAFVYTTYATILNNPNASRQLYFSKKDIWNPMSWRLQEFFEDLNLFPPQKSGNQNPYTHNFHSLVKKITAKDEIASLPADHTADIDKLKIVIADALNSVIYNWRYDLFTQHPTVKQMKLPRQLVNLYLSIASSKSNIHSNNDIMQWLYIKRILNREILNLMMPPDALNPDAADTSLAAFVWRRYRKRLGLDPVVNDSIHLSGNITQAVEENGKFILYDGSKRVHTLEIDKNFEAP